MTAIDADVVFLDVAHDRYHCLPNGGSAIIVDEHSNEIDAVDEAIATPLAAAGLVVVADDNPPTRPSHLPPQVCESLVVSRPAAPSWRHLPSLVAGLADSLIGYRPKSFAALIGEAERRRGLAIDDPSAQDALLCAVRAFHQWNVYAPVSGKCLLQCYVLQRALWRRGLAARWVFGVATWPFRAHCWLQVGDLALTDPVDRLRPYTPILAV